MLIYGAVTLRRFTPALAQRFEKVTNNPNTSNLVRSRSRHENGRVPNDNQKHGKPFSSVGLMFAWRFVSAQNYWVPIAWRFVGDLMIWAVKMRLSQIHAIRQQPCCLSDFEIYRTNVCRSMQTVSRCAHIPLIMFSLGSYFVNYSLSLCFIDSL